MSDTGHTSHGKWSRPGVPHRGWTCTGVEDLGYPEQECEMCESVTIRYVHYMEHPDYPDVLEVGCVCAEHMENDYVTPRLREKRLRSIASRRASWDRRKWRYSEAGNLYLNAEGFNLTVFESSDRKGRYWGLRVSHRTSHASQLGHGRYESADAAKRRALDALIWAKDHLPARARAAATDL